MIKALIKAESQGLHLQRPAHPKLPLLPQERSEKPQVADTCLDKSCFKQSNAVLRYYWGEQGGP